MNWGGSTAQLRVVMTKYYALGFKNVFVVDKVFVEMPQSTFQYFHILKIEKKNLNIFSKSKTI